MNLYRVERTDRVGYDEYDSVVVAAESEDEARTIQPSEYGGAWAPPDALDVDLIGIAKEGTERGVILASFGAG